MPRFISSFCGWLVTSCRYSWTIVTLKPQSVVPGLNFIRVVSRLDHKWSDLGTLGSGYWGYLYDQNGIYLQIFKGASWENWHLWMQCPVVNLQGEPSTNVSALTSQTASSTLSASGYPNARVGSTTSSGLLARTQSTLNPDEAREYSTKVCDLLVEFSAGDAVVKLHMCSLHLLIRLFQMLNKLEAPILVKVW